MEIKEKTKPIGTLICILEDVRTGKKTVTTYRNIVCLTGKVAIARRLGDIALVANEGKITYGAVGTGESKPFASDTKLDEELFRKVISSAGSSSNVSVIQTFYSTAEANGTLTEFGLFGEAASGAADSGTMYNHAAITITKTNSQTLTIEVQLEIA